MGIGEGALAKLGLKLEDVPTDWPGFLDFLEQTVKPRLDRLGPCCEFIKTAGHIIKNLIINIFWNIRFNHFLHILINNIPNIF